LDGCAPACSPHPPQRRLSHLLQLLPLPTAPRPRAQLPESQREGVPHHLLDILPPSADFSAGDFHALCRQAAADILAVRQLLCVACTARLQHTDSLGTANSPLSADSD
jgi:hypothetical protein